MRSNVPTLLLAILSIPAALVLASPGTARAGDLATAPATTLHMSIQGEPGSVFEDHEGSWEVYGWSHEVVAPRDAATGLPVERSPRQLLTVARPIDHSTPLLMRALVDNENLSVELRLLQADSSSSGTEQQFYTIQLENVTVANIRTEVKLALGNDGNMKHEVREHVSFCYQRITWNWTDGRYQLEAENFVDVPIQEFLWTSGAPKTREEITLAEPTARSGGNCANICTEVVACCVCKCFEENSWPFNYGCGAGCLVLDTVLGEDDEDAEFAFASADGTSPLSEPLVVDRRTSDTVFAEAGVYSPRREAFRKDSQLARVFFEVADLDSYLKETAGGKPTSWSFAGGAEPTGISHVGELSIRGLSEGPHLLRAVAVLADGSTTETMAMLEIR